MPSNNDLISLEGLRRIANDLTKLEINTIMNDQLSGRKLPGLEEAFLDIAIDYTKWLADNVGSNALPNQAELERLRSEIRQHIGQNISTKEIASKYEASGKQILEKIKSAAQATVDDEEVMAALAKESKDVIPNRIVENITILIDLLERYQQGSGDGLSAELAASDALALRKIWEIGTQVVLMQTVIQLDGDVITYIRNRNVASDAMLQRLHQSSVQTATDSWQFLVKTVGSAASNLVGVFVPGGRR